MAKTVFRPGEIGLIDSRVFLEPPFQEDKQEEAEVIEEINPQIFAGPSVEELQADMERRRAEWEAERGSLIEAAKTEAGALLENACAEAEGQITYAKAQAGQLIEDARKSAESFSMDAQIRAKDAEQGIEAKCEAARKAAEAEGFESGRSEGYEAGFEEVKRLIERARVVLERLQDKRSDIIADTEKQIVDLTLLIARKVVKTISESQRNVVIENIKEALAKLKTRGKVLIKVNLADLELATGRIAEFTSLVEGSQASLQILEDTSVGQGGCLIETDFGEIDARIANQLSEIESKILEISPVKHREH